MGLLVSIVCSTWKPRSGIASLEFDVQSPQFGSPVMCPPGGLALGPGGEMSQLLPRTSTLQVSPEADPRLSPPNATTAAFSLGPCTVRNSTSLSCKTKLTGEN